MNVHIPPALTRRLAGLQANQRLVEAGRKLVTEGVVTIQGFPEAEVDLFENWASNPFGSRSWQWAVAAFRFLPGVIAYHSSNDDDGALVWAVEALRSWRRAIRSNLREYEFARHDHAVAVQSENLVHLLAYLIGRDAHREDWDEIAAVIHHDADLLETEAFYSKHTNHGIEQARILGVIANFFPDHPRSTERMDLAVKRLTAELDFAFTKEGVHVENSPGYHSYVCLSFLKILDYFPREEISALADRIDALMPRAIRFLTHIVRPDGTLPIIGDTLSEPPPDYFRRYRKTRDYTYFSYAISDGRSGVRPPSATAFYPQAGYFIVRDAWQSSGQGRQSFHLVFRCGYRSRYHRHDDDLNVVVYCDGEDWLIDSGAYNYSEQDPIRRYLRSKWAHNVPVPFAQPDRRWRWQPPHATLPLLRLPSASTAIAVRGISHSYPGCVATRDLHVKPQEREFTVVDSLVATTSPGRQRYLSLWHIPDDKEVRVEGQRVIVTSKLSGRQLIIENMGRPAREIRLMDPGIPGSGPVASRSLNELEPIKIICFEWSGDHLHSSLRFTFDARKSGQS